MTDAYANRNAPRPRPRGGLSEADLAAIKADISAQIAKLPPPTEADIAELAEFLGRIEIDRIRREAAEAVEAADRERAARPATRPADHHTRAGELIDAAGDGECRNALAWVAEVSDDGARAICEFFGPEVRP
jgi:hypothetical protein